MNTNGRFSTYEERIARTPSEESGRWEGSRGESLCLPNSEDAKKALEEKGLEGIEYKDGEPDFSPVSESTVKIGYMTDERTNRDLVNGRDSKDTVYTGIDESGRAVDPHHKADPNSMADLHMKFNKPGNYNQADILTAEAWTEEKKDGRDWTAEDVAAYREDKDLTWHECGDCETMMLVPESVNRDFGHLGGVGEIKRRNEIIAEALEEYDAEQETGTDPELLSTGSDGGYEGLDEDDQAEFDLACSESESEDDSSEDEKTEEDLPEFRDLY